MLFSVCVPLYNRHEEPNLSTLAMSFPAASGGLEGELVVALNGLSSQEAGLPPTVQAVGLETNRGVAPGWNAAAAAAQGDVLIFTNDDVVLGDGSIARLVEALARREEAGVV